ncbi:uncharacterized protein LOC103312810 isoform X2 [Tribolium castaneum]|uniref:uncharacterized protein LOC103312810 isoform X2 n=1 Tax=Tribolium castaneum TaxID=7070 RepID=UPI00046C367A|nr:PREDICTED: uncharacterized protein LOC103312810 isoform X2 [Tribolium castaneum]|eukprot:XP_008192601.1 PREDICTED: uncharacterized protein LOC103312810 isoform X2 [Tribolium castaneum]
MSKRASNSRSSSTKKPRLDELDDDWGDDLDDDIIDDCLKRATQEHDVTLLTSYSVFKNPENMFTSTQQNTADPCTLEERIKQLQEKFAEKEGEISILRSNLQQVRASTQVDQERKQKEWRDKFCGLEKENKSIKSELEFKNLEVANLKQQIAELSKLINKEQSFTEKSKTTVASPKKNVKETSSENSKIHINTVEFYPLKSFTFSFLQKRPKVENSTSLNKKLKDYDLCSIYVELLALVNLSHNELDSEVGANYVNKVVEFSFQQLKNFHICMNQNEGSHLQDVSELDELYLQTSSLNMLNESAEKCGEIIKFLAEVVPFSTHLTRYLQSDPSPNSKINISGKFADIPASQYLLLLLELISTIGNNKTEKTFTIFLSAAVRLLCRLGCDDRCCLSIFYDTITQKLLSLNPDVEIIVDITLFLKIVTRNSNFVVSLCSKSSGEEKLTESVCRFHTFMVLLENNLQEIRDKKMLPLVVSNVVGFIYNIFRADNSLLYQETKTCQCLSQLYKLGIGIIYKSLKINRRNPAETKSICKKSMRILSLISFNFYELTQKYVKEFAQFKEILTILSETCDQEDIANLKNLEKLSLAEELPEVNVEKFLDVEL